MKKIFLTMPQPGETITEGLVVRWLVKPGQSIKEGDRIVELETQKALFEHESPYEGVLQEILIDAGQNAKVGENIAVVEVADEKAAHYELLGLGGEKEFCEKNKEECEVKTEIFQKVEEVVSDKKASPYVRRLLKEKGISDWKEVPASGEDGRITKEDVLNYVSSSSVVSSTVIPAKAGIQVDAKFSLDPRLRGDDKEQRDDGGGKDIFIECTPIRMRIANNMVEAKLHVPHAHTGIEIDMTNALTLRSQIRERFKEKYKIDLGLVPLLIPSLIRAIQAHPIVNSTFLKEQKQIQCHSKINLAMAVDTKEGLFTPVLKDVGKNNFIDVVKRYETLMDHAQKNKLSVDELTGATITFNNYGFFGTNIGIQVVIPPQVAIIGMGALQKKPWVVDDEIKIRSISQFMISFDHRVMDGKAVGLFLVTLKKNIENLNAADLID